MLSHRLSAGRVLALGLLAAALCVASITGAFADVMAPLTVASSSIDVSPFVGEIVNAVIAVAAPAVGTLLLFLLLQLQRLAGVKLTAEKEAATRAAVDQAMYHAAALARQRASAGSATWVDVGSEDLAAGARYAMQSIPDTLRKLGITDAASQRLKEMVEARLVVPTA